MEKQFNTWSKQMPHLVWNLLIIAAVLLIGYVVKVIVKLLLNYYKNKKDAEYSFLRSFVTHFSKSLNHFIPLLTLNILLPYFALKDVYADDIRKWFGILLVISFAALLTNAIKILEDFIYYKYDFNKEDNLKERKVRTQLSFVRKLSTVLIILITLSLILLSFDSVRKLGAGLLTGVGIGGIIIGFAAQKSLGNLLAGFQIAFTQPIRIDDVLVVEGEWGRVEDITLTYVVLNIWDQRRLILPINYFIEKPFQNWTRTTSQLLGTVFLYVDYEVPIDAMREELARLLEATPLWDKRVGIIQVTDVKPSTIELRVLVSARNSSMAFDLRCYIRENLIKYLQQNYPGSLPKNRIEINSGLDNFKKSFASDI
ncbi:mechanosensitive ion channel family protein [Mucilaginibacter conchicola]|uniref:Mechanosensitive ion channel family protein n=1 Tax=Mucilaginibacter conchicola TaxID=2303333 RepID=A0A372NVD7_9SPHI|nr:mechanosensitive ion channel domain-containing protein [Mucilaginibacter conchicola]RFZ94110.1 mechanosensitive ion channel family protein [Mucilaginibacter conchicola]